MLGNVYRRAYAKLACGKGVVRIIADGRLHGRAIGAPQKREARTRIALLIVQSNGVGSERRGRKHGGVNRRPITKLRFTLKPHSEGKPSLGRSLDHDHF